MRGMRKDSAYMFAVQGSALVVFQSRVPTSQVVAKDLDCTQGLSAVLRCFNNLQNREECWLESLLSCSKP